MKRLVAAVIVVLAFSFINADQPFTMIGRVQLFYDTTQKAVYWSSGMSIDADGSPRAYHPVSDSGSDALANAGHSGNWWGIVTDKRGQPVIQGSNDPAPGFYVSCTALFDPAKPLTDCNRYVNSDSVPYIVIPLNIRAGMKLGDIAKVTNHKNQRTAYAICADYGPRDEIGEGSIFLANQLGINSSPRTGGVSSGISYRVYEGSGTGKPLTRAVIDSIGRARDSIGK